MRFSPSTFMASTRGTAAIEYGLIAALVAVAAIGAFQSLAAANVRNWNRANSDIADVIK